MIYSIHKTIYFFQKNLILKIYFNKIISTITWCKIQITIIQFLKKIWQTRIINIIISKIIILLIIITTIYLMAIKTIHKIYLIKTNHLCKINKVIIMDNIWHKTTTIIITIIIIIPCLILIKCRTLITWIRCKHTLIIINQISTKCKIQILIYLQIILFKVIIYSLGLEIL